MLFQDAYVGLKVKALNCDTHETHPQFFPKEGTKGKIIAIDYEHDIVLVKWKKNSTSEDDKWYTTCYNIEPYKRRK